MNEWIDLSALWRIIVIGLVAGAGLPALFGVGLRLLSPTSTDSAEPARGGTAASPIAVASAALCFALVVGALGFGIYLIVAGG